MFRNLWFDGPHCQCELPPACIRDCSASGPVDQAVEFWVDCLQFDGPAWLIRRHLKGYGAWSAAELCDHQANRKRLRLAGDNCAALLLLDQQFLEGTALSYVKGTGAGAGGGSAAGA